MNASKQKRNTAYRGLGFAAPFLLLFSCTSFAWDVLPPEVCEASWGLTNPLCVYKHSDGESDGESDEENLENKTRFIMPASVGHLYTSDDGLNWIDHERELAWHNLPGSEDDSEVPPYRNLHSAAYGNGLVVVSGDWGYIFVSGDQGYTWARADNRNLKLPKPNLGRCPGNLRNCYAIFKSIDYGDGWFIGTGAGSIIGRTQNPFGEWEFYDNTTFGFPRANDNLFFAKVLYAAGSWIVLGSPPDIPNPDFTVLLYSKDNGQTWTKKEITGNEAPLAYLVDAFFSGGRFWIISSSSSNRVPGGGGSVSLIYKSKTADPAGDWELVDYADHQVYDVNDPGIRTAATNNLGNYYAIGRDNSPYIDFDSVGWRRCDPRGECRGNLQGSAYIVRYYNGLWRLGASQGYYHYSTNGKQWEVKRLGIAQLNDIVAF